MQKSKQVLKRRLWNRPWELIILWHQVGSAQKKGALMQRALSRHATQYTHILRRERGETSQKIKYRPRKPTCVPYKSTKDGAWIPPAEQVEFSGFARGRRMKFLRRPCFSHLAPADENLLWATVPSTHTHTRRREHFLWIRLSFVIRTTGDYPA